MEGIGVLRRGLHDLAQREDRLDDVLIVDQLHRVLDLAPVLGVGRIERAFALT
jgi:hypothetical protein